MENLDSAKKQLEREIMEAYIFLRKENMTVPSETLEFMKDAAIRKLYNEEDNESIAKEIILALDKYGRNANNVEYGLPIDPDFHSWDNKRAKEMLGLVMKIL